MKFLKYLVNFPEVIIDLYNDIKESNQEKIGFKVMALKRYCCYDSRKKRLNFEQEIAIILA